MNATLLLLAASDSAAGKPEPISRVQSSNSLARNYDNYRYGIYVGTAPRL